MKSIINQAIFREIEGKEEYRINKNYEIIINQCWLF